MKAFSRIYWKLINESYTLRNSQNVRMLGSSMTYPIGPLRTILKESVKKM